jgi:hypothetical protein
MLFFDMTKLGTIDLSSTSAEKRFFGDLAMWKSNFSLHPSKDLNFRHTSKKFKGGSPKNILEKKNVFPKKYVELRTFDGTCAKGFFYFFYLPFSKKSSWLNNVCGSLIILWLIPRGADAYLVNDKSCLCLTWRRWRYTGHLPLKLAKNLQFL